MQDVIARKLEKQARSCQTLGSPLYSRLLMEAADDVRAGGPTLDVMEPFAEEPPGAAVALKLMGAVHRLVLERAAPELATFYPNVGGTAPPEDAWPAFQSLLREQRDAVIDAMARPVQTNEVGRSAALVGGFLEVARGAELPLRLLEVGTSAGLNLRWDHFHYRDGEESWGPAAAPVRFEVFDPAPPFDAEVTVVSRQGVDPNPLDPASAEDRLTLSSYVWPDQSKRWQRLKGAFQVAADIPADVEKGSAADWLEAQLEDPVPGQATVVFHSIVMQYVSPDERERIVELMRRAGERATTEAPLAWLRMEPPLGDLGKFFAANESDSDVNRWLFPGGAGSEADHGGLAVVVLSMWPGRGDPVVLARAGYHGDPVVWLGGPAAPRG